MEKKLLYRVKPGYRHGALGQYGSGDSVELTESEAAGFLDKLELVGGSPWITIGGAEDVGRLIVTPSEFLKAKAGNSEQSETTDGDPPFDVSSANIDEVLAAVKSGKLSASAALVAEQQGKKRVSLIEALGKLVEAEGQPPQA